LVSLRVSIELVYRYSANAVFSDCEFNKPTQPYILWQWNSLRSLFHLTLQERTILVHF